MSPIDDVLERPWSQVLERFMRTCTRHLDEHAPRARALARGVRRGSNLVAMLGMLLMLMLVVAGIAASASRSATLMVDRAQGTRASYGVEAAANMAIREMIQSTDFDGDGAVGSISNDGLAANDPIVNGGRVWVTRSDAGGVVTLTARATNTYASRALRINLSTAPASDPVLFATRESPAMIRRSRFNASNSTWGTFSTSGTTGNSPTWAAATGMSGTTLVAATNSGNGLIAGVADSAGVATYTTLCNDVGFTNSRPFDVQTESLTRRGVVAYYDKNAQLARFRTVSGTTFSAASSMNVPVNVAPHFASADIPWIRLVSLGATSNELMAFTTHSCRRIWAARWTGSAWTGHQLISGTHADSNYDGVDAALESVSGRLVAVSTDSEGNQLAFRIFTPGTGWSSLQYRTGFAARLRWVSAAPVPGSNHVWVAASDENSSLRATRWNGSSWTSPASIVSNLGNVNERRFDIAASPDGTSVMVIYGKGSSAVFFRTWNGTSWSAEATAFTLTSGSHLTVLARPAQSGSLIVGAVGDSNGGVNAWSWNGATFGTVTRLGTTGSSFASHEWFAIALEGGGATTPKITGWAHVPP